MKKYLPLAASLFMLASCAHDPGFILTGTVNNPNFDGNNVYLYPYGVKDAAPFDSAEVKHGKFEFKGYQDVPELTTIRFSQDLVPVQRVPAGENSPYSATFLLENGKLTAVLDSASTVTGTPENDDQHAFEETIRHHRAEMNKAFEGVDEKDDNLLKAAERKYNEINQKITEKVVEHALKHIDRKLTAKTVYDFRHSLNEAQQNDIISKADSDFMAVPGISTMNDRLNVLKKVAVGQHFTNFEMAGMNGEMHELSDYVGNGKVTLIDFWASWCPPCRKEMPELVKLYKQYKNKGFEIVGISLDSNAEAWAKGVKDLHITWPQLSDLKGWQNAGAALYGVNSIPHLVLVSKEGIILAKNLTAEQLEEKLKELLN